VRLYWRLLNRLIGPYFAFSVSSFDVSLTLDKTFTEDLKDPNSDAYKELAAKTIQLVRSKLDKKVYHVWIVC